MLQRVDLGAAAGAMGVEGIRPTPLAEAAAEDAEEHGRRRSGSRSEYYFSILH
jgi:hypothetical protein